MKQSRMTAGSFAAVLNPLARLSPLAGLRPLAVLGPLAGLAASLAGALPARGADIQFTERVISTAATNAFSVFAIDLDGDGHTDVLSASFGDDKIAWYESDGGSPPSFTERMISTSANGALSVFATDVDGDGDTDVLSASQSDDKIAWYESDGGTPPSFTERVISTSADRAIHVFATDVDGDGDTDVLSASFEDDKIAWYESDGGSPPTFTERVISTTANTAVSVFATDLDGDGDTDVLSASTRDDKIAWYESDGGSPPAFTERVISSTANGAHSVFATDLDGDGDTDVLSASTAGKIAWYESDGGSPPAFTERVISTTARSARSVFATDVDGDGDTDVLSASFWDNTMRWYENTPPPTPAPFTERVISTTANGAISVFATDLDGDGDIDVLSASNFGDKIAWYENTTCGDGVVEGAEECDAGVKNSDTTPDACRTDCTNPSCGDNVLDTGEECNDGNTIPGDGCSATCQLEPTALLELLIQQVLALNLQQGIENSLDAKIDAAIQALDDLNANNDVAACNALQAFINAVDAQGGNQITQVDADALIAAVQEIMVALGCS